MARKYPGWLLLVRSAERVASLFNAEDLDRAQAKIQRDEFLTQIQARTHEIIPEDRIGHVLARVVTATCAVGPLWPDVIVAFLVEHTPNLDAIRLLLHDQSPGDWTVYQCPTCQAVAIYSPAGLAAFGKQIVEVIESLDKHSQRSACSHQN